MLEDQRFPARKKCHPPEQPTPLNQHVGQVTVLCVLRESPTFGVEDVNRLYRGIERNTTKKFQFAVLTDSTAKFDPGVNVIPLKHPEWTTKWSKLELFRPDIVNQCPWREQFFYADLDTVIVGSLDDILSYDGSFMMLRDFLRSRAHGSGLMSWSNALGPEMYYDFVNTPQAVREKTYAIGNGRGDQLFIRHHCNLEPHLYQDFWPDQVVSYKVHCVKKPRPVNARVVCFHGRPKVFEVTDKWIMDNWV